MPVQDQSWNAELYDQKHSFVFEYGQELLGWLDAHSGGRILDVGCGTGHLTQAIAQLTRSIAKSGAQVIGLDSSPSMIAAAQRAYPSIEFVIADASDFAFDVPFDAVFSNAALHWMPRADAVATCIARALRPGGRLVAEFGGKGCIRRITTAVSEACQEIAGLQVNHPWYFPALGEYASLLEQHGLAVTRAALFDRPTRLEGEDGIKNWLEMFGEPMLRKVPEAARPHVVERVEEKLRPSLYRDGVWFADYRRLRIVAVKE